MLVKVDEADQKIAAHDAIYLAKHNEDIRMAASTMLAARQLYSLASHELQQLCDRAVVKETPDEEARAAHPLVCDLLTKSVLDKSRELFEEINVFEGMVGVVLPWVKKTIEKHSLLDIKDRQKAKLEEETARKATTVPTGIYASELTRDKALILVGYSPAVAYLLNRAVRTALAATNPKHPFGDYRVIRFSAEAEPKPSEDLRLVLVGKKYWVGAASKKKDLALLLHNRVVPQLSKMPDLLVVDDLAAAVSSVWTPGNNHGGFAPYLIEEAHRKLSQWAKPSGIAFLAGVPSLFEKVDLTISAWADLAKHATIALVDATKMDGDLVRISVNDFFLDVTAADLAPQVSLIT